MNEWALIGALAAVTFAIKAAGPVVLGGRELPPAFNRFVMMLAPALLAALVAVDTLSQDGELEAGANTAGVAVAAVFLARGASVITGVFVAAAVTAGLRALG